MKLRIAVPDNIRIIALRPCTKYYVVVSTSSLQSSIIICTFFQVKLPVLRGGASRKRKYLFQIASLKEKAGLAGKRTGQGFGLMVSKP
jgi:hypothetical protein